MPRWVQEGYDEYEKRMPKELSPLLKELALANRGKNFNPEEAKKTEGKVILAAIPTGTRVIALDVKGRHLSTEQLSSKMEGWQLDGHDVAIVIGGPDGLSQECLKRADEKWSLSDLTLPHPVVRIVLIEQLYRAWTILQNHPYHK